MLVMRHHNFWLIQNILVKTFIKWNFFLYSWFYLQNTGKMYMYLLCLCTCANTQNYFKTYTGLTFSFKTNIGTMFKSLHLHYYFQTQVNTKKSCTQLLMRKIFYSILQCAILQNINQFGRMTKENRLNIQLPKKYLSMIVRKMLVFIKLQEFTSKSRKSACFSP